MADCSVENAVASDLLAVCNESVDAERDFLNSQSKLIEIIKSYKKGASLLEVERMQNEWKSTYQVSDVEAKQPLEVLRNMYAKAQKSKLNKSKSSSFSELRQFIGSKLRRKDSINSKNTSVWSVQKELHAAGQLETHVLRPMSTLSMISNTSSSSGSSFDALSSTSAGSDSGNHSDNYDDRNRYKHALLCKQRIVNADSRQSTVLLDSKPPAPPPRPTKTYMKPNHIAEHSEQCNSNTAVQLPHNLKSEHVFSDTQNFKGGNNYISSLNGSVDCYDIPPLPRPHRHNSIGSSFFITENFDYDFVPPPLPLFTKSNCSCSPKSEFNQCSKNVELHDIPVSTSSLDLNYDFPKTLDFSALSSRDNKETTAAYALSTKGLICSSKTDSECDRKQQPHYCNIFTDDSNQNDNIPEEFAPAPPERENMEDHYKMIGIPVPISIPD